MPGLDGIEAARRINQEGDTAIVILTAFSQRDLIEQAVEAGALAYLVKPYKRSELVPAVEIARSRHREPPPPSRSTRRRSPNASTPAR